MENNDELLNFLDLLDLDEELIDARLKSIMERSVLTNEHHKNAIQLLNYKNLVNIQDGTDCENEEEYIFLVKLINNVNDENIDYVCKIANIVLELHPQTIICKAEHLLQQILSNIEIPLDTEDKAYSEKISKIYFLLRICESILNSTLKYEAKVSLLYLDTPLENILDISEDRLQKYFLTCTVPQLFECVTGYNILDKIWDHIKIGSKESGLKVISCLSDYYLPITDEKKSQQFESEIVALSEFWDIILFGLNSSNSLLRKISIYLTKRCIEYLSVINKPISVQNKDHPIIYWNNKNATNLKSIWDSFFILIESLEEKQSNIVLPSLQLFDTVKFELEDCWLNCAFNLGLRHDNTQVKAKCIEFRLNIHPLNSSGAMLLLEALNDVNLYENVEENTTLIEKISTLLKNKNNLMFILSAMPLISWSPVPLYHLSVSLLQNSKFICNLATVKFNDFFVIINTILKIPCNHIALRKAIHYNVIKLSEYYFNNIKETEADAMKEIIKLIKLVEIPKNIELILSYLNSKPDSIGILLQLIDEKLNNINALTVRQYANKMECFNDVLFITFLWNYTKSKEIPAQKSVNIHMAKNYKVVFDYLSCLLRCDKEIDVEKTVQLYKIVDFNAEGVNKNVLLDIYKTCVLLLKSEIQVFDKSVLSMAILSHLHNNLDFYSNYKHEMLDLRALIRLVAEYYYQDSTNAFNIGKLRNIFYEKNCEMVYKAFERDEQSKLNVKEIVDFIENAIDVGGYGCLKWILKVVNKVIHILVLDENLINMSLFISRMWKEIEELKSNNQYNPCMKEFVNLVTQDAILDNDVYNNIVMLHCNKIVELGSVKAAPLNYLIKALISKNFKKYDHLVYVLCDILLFSPVPRKDQRITENLTVEVLSEKKYEINKQELEIYFNYELQQMAVVALSKIEDEDILALLTTLLLNKVDEQFKNKRRYHGNSQLHRTLLTALQHLLLIVLLNPKNNSEISEWCLKMLGRIPHQPSVRVCLEWYIALSFYVQKVPINEDIQKLMKSKEVPLTSQFMIMYLLLKNKIANGTYTEEEFQFAMDLLLFHSMGQMFNIRLHAQYLASELYSEIGSKRSKYDFTIKVIEHTFVDGAKDKNFIKLKDDYFANHFDIVGDLSPYFLYFVLPRYSEVSNNEHVDEEFVNEIMNEIDDGIIEGSKNNDLKRDWLSSRRQNDYKVVSQMSVKSESKSNEETIGTIQKKYIPWRSMSDVNVYEDGKKSKSSSELIVVASLVDKLPNLGGMARTSEVFGVRTYVVDSRRHLQDSQFRGLSVSAENWVDIEEVRPGKPLKDYLARKKSEGYSVVAAEQTSNSSKLQSFRFPKKTLLLLGHEKEGVPCDILPLMDHCVEIPQQGVVRSLNVHVTAAIFIWEYARQNVLSTIDNKKFVFF